MALALRDAGTLDIGPLPRMADYAQWAAAGVPALEFTPEQFMDAYRDNRAQAVVIGLDSSPVGHAVRTLMSKRSEWEGSANELLRVLAEVAGDGARGRAWPQSAKGLTNALRRLAPPLRAIGITWESARTAESRTIRVCKVAGQASHVSQAPRANDAMTLMTHSQPPCTHEPPMCPACGGEGCAWCRGADRVRHLNTAKST